KGLLLTLPLKYASAAEAVRVARQVYKDNVAPGARLQFTAEERTNSLSIQGSTEQVLEVMKLVAALEELGRLNSDAAAKQLSAHIRYSRVLSAEGRLAKAAGPDAAPAGPRLGVSVERVSPALADQLNLPPDVGLLVTEVVPKSTAANVGIQA